MKSHPIRSWRNRTPIGFQLILAVSGIIVLLSALLISYSYLTQVSVNQKRETQSLERVLELENARMESYVDELCGYSLLLRNDSSFMSVLSRGGALSYGEQLTVENAFRTLFYSRNDLQWMELYLIKPELRLHIDNPRRKVTSLPYAPPEGLQDYDRFSAPPGYLSVVPAESGFLQITRTIINSPHTTPLAVVRFQVNTSSLDAWQARHRENDEQALLFDATGAAFTQTGLEGTALAAMEAGRQDLSVDGARHLMVFTGGESSRLRAAVLKPVAVVNRSQVRTRNVNILIGLAALGLGILILVIGVRALTRPLSTLAERMQGIGSGDFQSRANLEGSVELAVLSEEFNRMNANIAELIDRNYVASLNERTAQLAALEAQTNPHFLFNTLQAISTEAILCGNQKLYRMISSLASLLRYTIKGGNLAPLSTELEYVEKYLTLQKARFGERLNYRIATEDALLDSEIPKLGLLALVENSVVHGMKGDVDSIHLEIRCEIHASEADIRVEDDGIGISDERMQALLPTLSGETVLVMENIGLGNLASRLRLLYAGRATLNVESVAAPARRTTVRMRIPLEAMKHA